uniref:UBN2_3 domain-containing protein n=1 Tax=Nicotiana tabacum TaxID=4097 RepID=A0A1S3WXC6_TOBAC|nr:PREDICTED: uncharacterized protein LOC107758998 [Nicotiana tabacum]
MTYGRRSELCGRRPPVPDKLKKSGDCPWNYVPLHSHASSVTVFNGLNFSKWHEQVQFHLGVMDIDLALLNDKPTAITDTSNADEKSFHKAWERSNKLSLMFMRMIISNNINSTIPQTESAREYLKFVEECFCSTDKSLTGTLMAELTT